MKVRGTLVEPLGMIEKKKETLRNYRDYIKGYYCSILGLHWVYIGIMGKRMEVIRIMGIMGGIHGL